MFVVEALSVIVQVGWFRYTRRRVFRCAPLHHHFQLPGWPEDKIVVRFWIAGGICAAVGLALSHWRCKLASSDEFERSRAGGGESAELYHPVLAKNCLHKNELFP